MASIKDVGWYYSEVTVSPKKNSDKYLIIDGNRRITALQRLAEEDHEKFDGTLVKCSIYNEPINLFVP